MHIKRVLEDNAHKVYQVPATQTYACNKCSLRFSSQANLKEHKKVMHRSFLSFLEFRIDNIIPVIIMVKFDRDNSYRIINRIEDKQT